jgi:hypothetical protein
VEDDSQFEVDYQAPAVEERTEIAKPLVLISGSG